MLWQGRFGIQSSVKDTNLAFSSLFLAEKKPINQTIDSSVLYFFFVRGLKAKRKKCTIITDFPKKQKTNATSYYYRLPCK